MVVGGGATRIAIDRPREVLLQEARDLGAHLLPLGIPERELELAVFQVEAEILGPHALDDLVGNHERQTVCTLVDRHRLAVAAGRYGGLAADKSFDLFLDDLDCHNSNFAPCHILKGWGI